MVLLEFSIVPIGKGESVGDYVARCLKIIDESGLDYRAHAMGTVIEGEVDQVLAVWRKCYDAIVADCDRVTCTAKLEYRKDHPGELGSRIQRVEQRLGRELKKA